MKFDEILNEPQHPILLKDEKRFQCPHFNPEKSHPKISIKNLMKKEKEKCLNNFML